MGDDLVNRIFVEIAVLEGKRDVDGRWLTNDSTEIPRLMKRAFAAVARAGSPSEDVGPTSPTKAVNGGAKSPVRA